MEIQLELPFPEPDQRPAFLALCQLSGVGYWTLRKLAERFNSFEDVFKQTSAGDFFAVLSNAGGKSGTPAHHPDWEDLKQRLLSGGRQLLTRLRRLDIDVAFRSDGQLPRTVSEISEPPYWLFVQGNGDVLSRPSVAVVGTRNATDEGRELTWHVCRALGNQVTVSGLAAGIDLEAHLASLHLEIPTIAVLGSGILFDYPVNSEETRRSIVNQGGAIVSEYLPNERYSAANFVRRNRLQAALAHTVVPVEWAIKSGTAHTVRYAHAYGKKIICLKHDNWKIAEHPELELGKTLGAKVVDVPSQMAVLREALT